MKFLYHWLIAIAFFIAISSTNAQSGSIMVNDVERTYEVHLPYGYDESLSYPLVINLHGLGSNAKGQQERSKYNYIADRSNMIVVYPNALFGVWDVATEFDTEFIIALVDSLREDYSINDCVFAMGFSMGGFMAYKLACSMDLSGIAVVSGNMDYLQQSECELEKPVPLIHFHGTEDRIVPYKDGLGTPDVEITAAWWAAKNQSLPFPITTPMPDLNTADGSTVDKLHYISFRPHSEVVLYKIKGGGHTWPYSEKADWPTFLFGKPNYDVDASLLIGIFFFTHCDNVVLSTEDYVVDELEVTVFPNPTSGIVSISLPGNIGSSNATITLLDQTGLNVFEEEAYINSTSTFDFTDLTSGIYFLKVVAGESFTSFKKITIK